MGELLLELLSEEIPARMQRRAIDDLATSLDEWLQVHRIQPQEPIRRYVTPRRLTLIADGIPEQLPEQNEERRGPRVGAPAQAVDGFLRSAGLKNIEDCEVRDTDRGQFYFTVIKRPGRPTADVLPDTIRSMIDGMRWPKSMRFPAASFRWVRPLTSVLCLFDGEVVPVAFDEVPVGRVTQGHRFLSPGTITVASAADYLDKLEAAHVLLDHERRRALIEAELERIAAAEGVTVKPDIGLLDEVNGLVEYPVVLMGAIDDEFVRPLPEGLPPEVLATAMRTHQKYFSCLRADGSPAPRFLFVANNKTPDAGKAIIAGNERVLRARLADARFFWDQDRKVRLEERVAALKDRVYYDKLGTMLDKTERVAKLAGFLSQQLYGSVVPAEAGTQGNRANPAPLDSRVRGNDKLVELAQRAARLAKADLSTGMVGEFPELQGLMGRYYALNDGEDPRVADAIADHYKPLGPNDTCPTEPVSIIVALADKIDALAAFFFIGEEPTGSRDPFALRRAALGLVRIVVENKLDIRLSGALKIVKEILSDRSISGADNENALEFITERLQIHRRSEGVRYDIIKAAFLPTADKPIEDNLLRLLRLVDALTPFVDSEDGGNLLTAFRRAANIVEIEARNGGWLEGDVRTDRLVRPEEITLAKQLSEVDRRVSEALLRDDFNSAMNALAMLREPVDRFFDNVTVNASESDLRENRLRLLLRIRQVMNRVAHFREIGRHPQAEERRAA